MRFLHSSCLVVVFSIATGPVWAQIPTVQDTKLLNSTQLLLNASNLDADVVNFTTADLFVANADPLEELLGATLKPVDDVLRAQLVIPAGQGLLVASLRANGPSAESGLQKDDILLSLAAKPLASTDDLTKQLLSAGQSNVPLKVLRGGKGITIQVRPQYRVTFGPVAKEQTEYYIGVSLEPIEDALRTQLGLVAGQGVVITDVVKGSAAEKAGVQKHDLALELGGKPVATPEALAHQVQENRDTPSTLKLLRAGKVLTVPITGGVRKMQASSSGSADKLAIWVDTNRQYANGVNDQYLLATRKYARLKNQEHDQVERQLQVEKELKALRERVDKLIQILEKSKRE
jgi:membrane-associated protease RseP (regulator of RpoE activity)